MNNKKVALFIDSENISHAFIDDIINNLTSHGEVVIRKIYGNWKDSRMENWDNKIHDYSLEAIYQKPYNNSSKNASDIKITVDIMKTICQNKDIEIIALATSDSDFTPLIQEIKQDVQIIGFGESKTNSALQNACSEFNILTKEKKTSLEKNRKLIDRLKHAIKTKANEKGIAYLSDIGKYIKDRYSDSAKNYGSYNSWGSIFKELSSLFDITYQANNGRNDTMLVSIKGDN